MTRIQATLIIAIALIQSINQSATAQTAQVGADLTATVLNNLKVEYIGYRQARWETEHVKEYEADFPNQGGFMTVYLRNVGEAPMQLRFWRLNHKDESYWRLNRQIAWDRTWDKQLAPGEMTVAEINGITPDFAPGAEVIFAYTNESWLPAGLAKTTLAEDNIQVSYIRVLPGLRELHIFTRQTTNTPTQYDNIHLEGAKGAATTWALPARETPGPNIARVTLEEPLRTGQMIYTRLNLRQNNTERAIYAHRRAFEDRFPIGTWGGEPELLEELRRMHIDTCVNGGKRTDPFFAEHAPRLGFHCTTHTQLPVNIDTLRELGDEPAVTCWMLQDEPDWSYPAQVMLFADETVRQYNSTKPTFITLCRNTKFFEYAPISDIPCMDHYAVTAPSSSLWPTPYGTRLEETGYYTRDLKAASEPKPIWIWSQGLFNWNERPKRPVPTPEELDFQLLQNIGRGAKGILWFSYRHELGERWPEVREAMRGWGRVMALLREEILSSEPAPLPVSSNHKIDIAPLVGWDSTILCLTNPAYEIHPEAYPFTPHENLQVTVELPPWLDTAKAWRITPEGLAPLATERRPEGHSVQYGPLKSAGIIYFSTRPDAETTLQQQWDKLRAIEAPGAPIQP